jgi:hypothetical protein
MISLANAFILVLLGCAGLLGVSALVEKRTVKRHRDEQTHTNAAA